MIPIIYFFCLGLFQPTEAALDCLRANEECREKDLYSFTGINSSEQCSTLCQDDPDCVAFTHYNQDSFPLSDMCVLFAECIYRNPCNNCITGSSQNQCTCGIRYHGAINDNNLVQLISLTSASEKEPNCKARCVSHKNCTA